MMARKALTLLGAAAILLGGCGNGADKSKEAWMYERYGDAIARAKWTAYDKTNIELLAAADAFGEIIEDDGWLYYMSGDDFSIRKTKYNPRKVIRMKASDYTFTSKLDKKEYTPDDTDALEKELGKADEILVYSGSSDQLALDKSKKTLYFVNEDEDYNLFSVKTDGTGATQLTEDESVDDVAIAGDHIVYATYDGIFAMKKDGSGKKQLTDDSADWIETGKGWIYYSDTQEDDPVINRIKLDGSGKEKVLSGDYSNEQVVGDWIYFVRDDETYRSKGDGSKVEKLK